jgi:hypothetical protein
MLAAQLEGGWGFAVQKDGIEVAAEPAIEGAESGGELPLDVPKGWNA